MVVLSAVREQVLGRSAVCAAMRPAATASLMALAPSVAAQTAQDCGTGIPGMVGRTGGGC